MNKKLIDKNIHEFMHWLRGGSILVSEYCYDEYKYSDWTAVSSNNEWDYSDIYKPIFVINDEFVEFRKALAEGKVVQYNFGNYGINRKDFPNTWKDLDLSIGILADRACPENYRIKPEEPKFKVGDWVRDLRDNRVFQINSVNFNLNLSITNGVYIHWQPKPGEWCWFYQSKREIPTLGNLKYFSDKDSFCAYSTPKASMSVKYFKHCEPFLGQLPTNLQDIK